MQKGGIAAALAFDDSVYLKKLCMLSDFDVVEQDADLVEVIGDGFSEVLEDADIDGVVAMGGMIAVGDVLLQDALELEIVFNHGVELFFQVFHVILGEFHGFCPPLESIKKVRSNRKRTEKVQFPIVATQSFFLSRDEEREKTLFAKVFSRNKKKVIRLCRKYILPQRGDFVNS